MSDKFREKLGSLAAWAIMFLAMLAAQLLASLVQQWTGRPVEVPVPPIVYIQPDPYGEAPPQVWVIHPKPIKGE